MTQFHCLHDFIIIPKMQAPWEPLSLSEASNLSHLKSHNEWNATIIILSLSPKASLNSEQEEEGEKNKRAELKRQNQTAATWRKRHEGDKVSFYKLPISRPSNGNWLRPSSSRKKRRRDLNTMTLDLSRVVDCSSLGGLKHCIKVAVLARPQ